MINYFIFILFVWSQRVLYYLYSSHCVTKNHNFVFYLVRPDRPTILQPVPVNSIITGINGVDLNLVCLSTGGYPQQTLNWFLIRNGQTPTRVTLIACNTSFSHDAISDLYNVTNTCTFTPTYGDDGATFSCQSSYSGEPQLEDSTEVQFEIACRFDICLSLLITTLITLFLYRNVIKFVFKSPNNWF